MMNVLIVDDEKLSRIRVKRLLGFFEDVHVVGESEDAYSALIDIMELSPDLVFLDIEMPEKSGMELFKDIQLIKPDTIVIFLTAHSEYAIDAFDIGMVDYLTKPIALERLGKALDRVRTHVSHDAHDNADKYVSFKVGGYYKRVNVKDVIAIISEEKYSHLYYVDGEALLNESLNEIECKVAHGLVRIHRNALVGLGKIERLERCNNQGYKIHLQGMNHSLEVSRRNVKTVKKLINTN
jgi:two-component system, LytTR family, response regulator AlgR